MPIIDRIESYVQELIAIRHDLHRHPELGFCEHRTAAVVANILSRWGVEVHTGIGGTGVVGIIRGTYPGARAIGLRADMDALPMQEETGLSYSSINQGVFHGCGHDGHVAALLGAARHLNETRSFAGTVVLIFQPAEEGLGGARAMIADGLFIRFPCDEIYSFHNSPYDAPGQVGFKPGISHAGADFFDITIAGTASHAAAPHLGQDPIIAGASMVSALQTLVSRGIDPLQPAVLSVTRLQAGNAYNVIPQKSSISGTIRYLRDPERDLMRRRIHEIAMGIGNAHGVTSDVNIRQVFSVLTTDVCLTDRFAEAAAEVAGKNSIVFRPDPFMGSEDFSDMLAVVPGSYCTIGHAGRVPVHHPQFVFDDGVLPLAASVLARIAERRLSPDATA